MSLSEEFVDYLLEVLEPLGGIRSRRMFGGAGLFQGEVMFAIVDDDALYFRTDPESAAPFEAENCPAFTYRGKAGKRITLPYHRAPDRLLDDAEEMTAWAGAAIGTALRCRGKD